MKLTTTAQMRELDRTAIEERHISSVDLMERAAQAICTGALELLADRAGRRRAAVFCGSGNNGGDGIAAAMLLFLAGVRVRAFLVGRYEKLTPDALEMTGRLSECGVELEPFDPEDKGQRAWTLCSDILIDALFGVGLSREIEPSSLYGRAVALLNEAPGKVVSADIPSGVSADSGSVLGMAVKADRTITFTLPKIGHYVGDGGVLSGEVLVRGIGIPIDLVNELCCTVQTAENPFAHAAIPPRKPDGHKGNFGKVLVVGGSVGFTGAPYLTAEAAMRTGCGLVYLGVPASIWKVEASRCISTMPFPLNDHHGMLSHRALQLLRDKLSDCDVLALGPGLGRSPDVTRLVLALLQEAPQPVVLDADGINALEGHMDVLDARKGRVTILTPHDGEFARIGGDLSAGRIETSGTFAVNHGCILVRKGYRTLTAVPQGNVLVNTTGNSGLAKGGSGDILTGIIASLLAQGATPVQAAAGGVFLHGRAGDLAASRLTAYGMTPEDVIGVLPEAIGTIL